MDNDERTYSKSEIRERRREVSQLLALQQRQLDALAKMDEAADELEEVEREIAALTRREARAEQSGPAVPPEPATTGERGLTILQAQPDIWLTTRQVLAEMAMRGWAAEDDHARQALRASLRRLARRNDQVERDDDGMTHSYRWVSRQDGQQVQAPAAHLNGHPAHQGGLSDG